MKLFFYISVFFFIVTAIPFTIYTIYKIISNIIPTIKNAPALPLALMIFCFFLFGGGILNSALFQETNINKWTITYLTFGIMALSVPLSLLTYGLKIYIKKEDKIIPTAIASGDYIK